MTPQCSRCKEYLICPACRSESITWRPRRGHDSKLRGTCRGCGAQLDHGCRNRTIQVFKPHNPMAKPDA